MLVKTDDTISTIRRRGTAIKKTTIKQQVLKQAKKKTSPRNNLRRYAQLLQPPREKKIPVTRMATPSKKSKQPMEKENETYWPAAAGNFTSGGQRAQSAASEGEFKLYNTLIMSKVLGKGVDTYAGTRFNLRCRNNYGTGRTASQHFHGFVWLISTAEEPSKILVAHPSFGCAQLDIPPKDETLTKYRGKRVELCGEVQKGLLIVPQKILIATETKFVLVIY